MTVIGRGGMQSFTFSSSRSNAAGATAANTSAAWQRDVVGHPAARQDAHGVDARGIDARDRLDLRHERARERHVVDVRDAARPDVPARPGGAAQAVGKRHDDALGIQRGGVGRAAALARARLADAVEIDDQRHRPRAVVRRRNVQHEAAAGGTHLHRPGRVARRQRGRRTDRQADGVAAPPPPPPSVGAPVTGYTSAREQPAARDDARRRRRTSTGEPRGPSPRRHSHAPTVKLKRRFGYPVVATSVSAM